MVTINDGGRAAAGYAGDANDCVTRAISIALRIPYQQVYEALARGKAQERLKRKRGSPRDGVHRTTYESYLKAMGWRFVPTMAIGSGCKVHLRSEDLPKGRIIASCSKHLVAVIDGVIHDSHDSTRGGTRCVYGYYVAVKRPTLIEAAKAVMKWADTATVNNNSERTQSVGDLRAAIAAAETRS